MGFRRDEEGQLILLAGILIVLSFLLLSTQAALLANVGQQAGRESAAPLLTDYRSLRSALPTTLELELTDPDGQVLCPDDADDWRGRVEGLLSLVGQLQSGRGQGFGSTVTSDNIPPPDGDGDGDNELETGIEVHFTDGDSTVFERFSITVECIP